LLESTYRVCLLHAMERDGLAVRDEVALPIEFQGVVIQAASRVRFGYLPSKAGFCFARKAW